MEHKGFNVISFVMANIAKEAIGIDKKLVTHDGLFVLVVHAHIIITKEAIPKISLTLRGNIIGLLKLKKDKYFIFFVLD